MTGRAIGLRPRAYTARVPYRAYVDGFRAEHPDALSDPRGAARFLVGYPSKLLTSEGFSEHPAYGCLRRCEFRKVLAWRERDSTDPPDPPEMLEHWASGADVAAKAAKRKSASRSRVKAKRKKAAAAYRIR